MVPPVRTLRSSRKQRGVTVWVVFVHVQPPGRGGRAGERGSPAQHRLQVKRRPCHVGVLMSSHGSADRREPVCLSSRSQRRDPGDANALWLRGLS